jgi:hypothetical protein
MTGFSSLARRARWRDRRIGLLAWGALRAIMDAGLRVPKNQRVGLDDI